MDHTEVSENYTGKGLGRQMLSAAVDFAREKGLKILPLCPFAKSVFDKEADLEDVLF
ncbi:GNAT family N-acetyltransferase [Sphingobacterium thalpophilum]|uniref:GNAT family N-acetyltransferase n=1 Tax=Sphingobacterium thalpophilum TaxID=259 RepID=UPI0039822B83